MGILLPSLKGFVSHIFVKSKGRRYKTTPEIYNRLPLKKNDRFKGNIVIANCYFKQRVDFSGVQTTVENSRVTKNLSKHKSRQDLGPLLKV